MKRVVARYKGMLRRQSQLRKENEKINFQSNKGKIVPLTVFETGTPKKSLLSTCRTKASKKTCKPLGASLRKHKTRKLQ